jgi:hypothetical protein
VDDSGGGLGGGAGQYYGAAKDRVHGSKIKGQEVHKCLMSHMYLAWPGQSHSFSTPVLLSFPRMESLPKRDEPREPTIQ